MNDRQELRLRAWLGARDPGSAPAALRTAVTSIPERVPTRSRWRTRLDDAFRVRSTRPAWIVAAVALLLAALVVVGAGLLIRNLLTIPRFPPGGLIAYASTDREVWVVRADGSDRRPVTHTTLDGEVDPHWSADGHSLLVTRLIGTPRGADSCVSFSSSSLVVVDVAASSERVLLTLDDYAYAAAWSPDGRQVAFLDVGIANCKVFDAGPPPTLRGGLIDVATGQVTDIPGGAGSIWQQWIGRSIAYVFDDHLGFVDAAAANSDSLRDEFRFEGPGWAVLSGDGRTVALWKAERDLSGDFVIADRLTGDRSDLGPGGAGSFSPDSGSVVYIGPEIGAGRAESRALLTASAPGWEPRQIGTVVVPPLQGGQTVQNVPELSWTPDGQTIYWLDDSGAHAIEIATGLVADLPSALSGCVDLDWQPLPPS